MLLAVFMCFSLAVAILGYPLTVAAAFLPPLRRAPPWSTAYSQVRRLLASLSCPTAGGLITPTKVPLAFAAVALGLLLHRLPLALLFGAATLLTPGWSRRRRNAGRRRELLL